MLPEITLAWAIRWGVIASSLSLYYIVFSLGLVLTFGLHKVTNFAHGAIYMVGAYIGLVVFTLTGNFGAALIAGFAGPFALGALFERGLISRLYGADPSSSFLVTFGLSFILVGIVKALATAQYRAFEVPGILAARLDIGGATVLSYRLFFIGIAVAIVIGVYLFLTKTKIGSIVRAGTADSTAVEVLGINIKNYFTLMFGIGSGLAGLTGVLFAPLFNVYPTMGDEILLWAFIVVIIGGLGSFVGSIVGAIIIGILHSLGSLVFGEYVMFATYAVLIIVLSVRPTGIFGGREA
jgi:branched-subunit amino acid ABC-type transport system permease component